VTDLYQPPGESDLVAEFLSRPDGPHSPELQVFVKALLADPPARAAIIITLVPFRSWAFATLIDPVSQFDANRTQSIIYEHSGWPNFVAGEPPSEREK
jgi:hypothetical protein